LPANPLHFLSIAPLVFRRAKTFDITALLYSSTLVDLELLFPLLTGQPPHHGFWHSYFFVLTVYPVALSLVVYTIETRFDRTISNIHRFFRFSPEKVRYPFRTIYFCCLIGGVSHIFSDMWVHEISPYVLFPFYEGNPFWIGEWSTIIHLLVSLLSLYTIFLWIRQLRSHGAE